MINKKLAIATVAGVLLVGGNIGKNIYIEKQFQEKVEQSIAQESLLYDFQSGYSCSGLFTVSCSLEDVSFKVGQSMGSDYMSVNAKNITIDDIQAAQALEDIESKIKSGEYSSMEDLFKMVLAKDFSYKTDFEGVRFFDSDGDIKKGFNQLLKHLENNVQNKQVTKIFAGLIDKYQSHGFDGSVETSVDNGDINAEVTLALDETKIQYGGNIHIDTSKLKRNDIASALTLKNIKLSADLGEYEFPEILYAVQMLQYSDGSRYKKQRLNRQLQEITGNRDLTYDTLSQEHIKEFAKSKHLDSITQNIDQSVEKMLKRVVHDEDKEAIREIKENVIAKAKKLLKGEDNTLELALQSKVTAEDMMTNFQSSMGGADVTLSELIELEIN